MSDSNSRDAVLAAWACGIADRVIPLSSVNKPLEDQLRSAVQRAKLVGILMWAATHGSDKNAIDANIKHIEEIRPPLPDKP